MRLLKSHPFVVPVTTFLVLFFVTLAGFVANGGQVIEPSDSHVVRLHVDGEQQIVPTRAKTVGEFLERRGINAQEKDIIEPPLDSPITDDNFEINVYKARAVVVIDNGVKIFLVTAQPTLEGVVEEAGVKVNPEDKIETAPPEQADPTQAIQEGLVGERVIIKRAMPIKLNLYGSVFEIRTHADTVEDLLNERSIKHTESSVFPTPETELKENDLVVVTEPGKTVSLEEEKIPFTDRVINDSSLLAGEKRVQREGRTGRRVLVYEVHPDGSKQALQEIVLVSPINAITRVGTKVIISNPSANVRLGEQLAAERGWTGAQWQCLYQLWQRESGWSTTAGNPRTGAYGIPQALPGSKMGSGWQSDASVQISWGLGYIGGRYGTPCGAWNYFQAANWY